MSEDKEEFVRNLLSKESESPVYRAAADILRALVILYGSGWESELFDVLMGLWSVRGLGLEQMGEIQQAVPEAAKLLSEAGIIKVERRMHAVGPKPEEETFYSAEDPILLIRLFASDRDLDKYRFETSSMGFQIRRR